MVAIFINRWAELEALTALTRDSRLRIVYLYGPRGVGVSSLLRQYVARAVETRDYLAVYIDAYEGDDLDNALIASGKARQLLAIMASSPDIAIGRALLYSLPVALVRLGVSAVSGKHVVIIVDHIDKGIGAGRVLDYLDSLRGVAYKLLSWRAASVTIIGAGTQLGLTRILGQGKPVEAMMIKGLGLDHYRVLVNKLGLSVDAEELWRLTGGNPGETITIATRYRGDIEFWRRALAARARRVFRIIHARGLISYLREAVIDINNAPDSLADILQAYDIVVRSDLPVLGLEPSSNGKWSWSLPVYKEILEELVKRQSS